MQVGKLIPQGTAKVNFPGFQKVLDFTSAGSESSVSVTVASDTDKEYIILVRNLDTSDSVNMLIGGDTSTYGYQRITNTGGTIAAAQDTSEATIILCPALSFCQAKLLCATGFPKLLFLDQGTYTSGTTVANTNRYGYVYDGTANFTSLDFSSSSGNFTSGTRIIVYAGRSQS